MGHARSFWCCDKRDTDLWRVASLAIGWLALIGSTWLVYEILLTDARESLIVSIIYSILVILLNVSQDICKFVTVVLCVVHWITCAMWLCGNANNITECMLASLLWWGVELGFFLISIGLFVFFFGLYESIFYYSAWKLEHIFLIISTVTFVLFYIIAIISFKSIKKSVEKYPVNRALFNVTYTETTETTDDNLLVETNTEALVQKKGAP